MNAVGATSLGWGATALPRIFTELAELGGRCVELNNRPGQHDDLAITGPAVGRVRRWAAEAGIAITSIAGYNDFAAPSGAALAAEVDRLLASCRLAAELGVAVVRSFVGEPRPGRTVTGMWPSIVGAFQDAAGRAGALGVTLAIENHGRLLNDGPALARLVGDIGASNVGCTLDTGNFSWAGHDLQDTWRDFDAVLPLAVNVHVKDVRWVAGAPTFVPAGTGEIGVATVLERLRAVGYTGAILSEYEGAPPFADGTAASIRFLIENTAGGTP